MPVPESQTQTGNAGPLPERGKGPERPHQGERTVLILNHRRDPIEALESALGEAGFAVQVSTSLADTQRLVKELRPAATILNPLVLTAGGIELEFLEKLQRDDDPVPVLLFVPDAASLAAASKLGVPLCDFMMPPHDPIESVQRIELQVRMRERFKSLHKRTRDLEGQVSIDFKTNLLSERYFKKVLHIEFKRAQRHQLPLSLLLLDVDDFKGINDSTEYAFGDEVLTHIARILKENIRETDFAARFGGDEFVLLLPQTTPAEAVQTAIRIRERIAVTQVRSQEYCRNVTVSIGIDSFDGRSAMTTAELRSGANKALKEAKTRGKDRVWLHSGDSGGKPAATAVETE